MSGSLLRLAKRDAKRFVTSGGFEESITISTPTQDMTLSLTGFATKHHINFDSDGNQINSKNAHICISESDLQTNSYPVRNVKGEISLLKHRVSYPDSSGIVKNYIVKDNYPDEMLGLIVLILGDYTV